jgi:prefoldin beta subunit
MTNEKIGKETQEQIMQMQLLQQRLQVFAAQKQQIQIQKIEIDNALKEVSKSKKPVYTIIGEIMVERSVAEVKKSLTDTKKEIDIKIKNLERQEKKTLASAEELQQKVTKVLK